MKTTPHKASSRPSAKPVQRHGTPGATGTLTRGEIANLVMTAREAYAYQLACHRIEPGQSFDDWRRDQVQDAVQKDGLSKLNRADFRPVKSHFLILAGREDEALNLDLRTGVKTYRPANTGDTWESSEKLVHHIRKAIADHATTDVSHPKGHIHTGWFLAAARQRAQKPTLTMDTLAERLDPETLTGLLSHLRNHIAVREGRADPDRRAKRVYPKKADPGEMSGDPF